MISLTGFRPEETILLDSVSFAYASRGREGKKVLDGTSLSIGRGEFAGIMGRTGCGKTTLLLTLNGIVPKLEKGIFAGRVVVGDIDVSTKSVEEMSKSVSFVFQDPNDQIFSFSVLEEVSFALKLRGLSESKAADRAKKALEEVGLRGFGSEDPTELSQGQKQKVAIATAIAMDTPVIVLDEPTASLDFESALQVYGLLGSLNERGKTIVVAEHDSEFLYNHASKLFVLQNGRASERPVEFLKSKKMEEMGLRRVK